MRASCLLLAVWIAACGYERAPRGPDSVEPQVAGKQAKRPLVDLSESSDRYNSEAFSKTFGASAGALGGQRAAAPAPASALAMDKKAESPSAPPLEPAPEAARQAAPPRAWFPETFLFSPRVVTDAEGRAEVEAKVPDRLTTWRVLALAHSRGGGQAGALTSFRGTLPAYVDPVVPPFLFAGDRIRLPVQVVNTTAADIAEPLAVEVQGARGGHAAAALRVPSGGSALRTVEVAADRPGTAVVRAVLGATDAVVRAFPIHPSGRPLQNPPRRDAGGAADD